MILNEGDIITLNANGKDYIVIKNVFYNNVNYYYLMTTDKPVEVNIVKLLVNSEGTPIIETVTEPNELNTIVKLVANTLIEQ